MLNENTIAIIKSTVPVLEKYGTDITKRFYQLLFTNHPELLNVFNQTNQQKGRQQTALANAVYAAAVHIDNLAAILPVVKQIGHKHRSLGIQPEAYPIVGENLLAAIKDVLGDAATDEILQAWGEAYGVIADAFIGVEAEMYKETEDQAGGWSGFRAFRIDRKVQESDVITSFYLVPQDGKAIASFLPGQYVTVQMKIPGEEYTHMRQYSLSDSPDKPYYRISVKREDSRAKEPAGKVSVYLHESLNEGDELLLSAPAGDFILDQAGTRPVVFIGGGVGFTPLMSMMQTVLANQPERKITFIQAAQNEQVHAMKAHVQELAEKNDQLSVHICYEKPLSQDRTVNHYDHEGFIDAKYLKSVLPSEEADIYLCGPVPFMKAVYAALQANQVPTQRIHYEFFGPAGSIGA
ncbi:NO-inducible flavohemoprotein [Paenibacillus albiflavus]|uniref:Flavohemoprotein n=1 Tax=Paenibacillus albiflavus TaxID=2545760 RepID=A0A4R4EIT6_9BACL|nr:NO-inducible flavohemoprotein [Paenibacillus albiflavus]TCZ78261.1 NO-inducible flavohemoprotein [Paenibacillus albiflavus]